MNLVGMQTFSPFQKVLCVRLQAILKQPKPHLEMGGTQCYGVAPDNSQQPSYQTWAERF